MQLNFSREHDDSDIEKIDKEIKEWELMFTDGKVMRSHYETEEELDRDWYLYMSQYYELKCIANNMAYRLYGMKNEEIYKKFKHYFLTKVDSIQNKTDEIVSYAPSQTLYEEMSYKDKEAEDVYNSTGYYVITDNNKDSNELNNQLYKFKSMSRDKQVKSNDYSLKIYGKTNDERYNEMITKLLSTEPLEDEEISISYTANKTNQMDIDESYNSSTINKLEKTREFIQRVGVCESIFIVEELLDHTKIKTDLERSIKDTLIESLKSKIHETIDGDNYLGYKTPYFLPSEIIRLSYGKPIFKDKFISDWLIDYQSRIMGYKPISPVNSTEWRYRVSQAMSNNDTDTTIALGWNPSIEFNEDALIRAGKRVNGIIHYNMGYDFVDLSEMTVNTPLSSNKSNNGIYIMINHDEDVSNDTPFALLSFNSSLEPSYPIIKDSKFIISPKVVKYTKFKNISVYYIKLPKDMIRNNDFISYLMNNGTKDLYPRISNEKLFVVNTFNKVLDIILSYEPMKRYNKKPRSSTFSLANLRGNSTDYIYNIYRGKSKLYNKNQVNALESRKSLSSITEDHQLYPFINIVPIRDTLNNMDPQLYDDANAFLKEYEKRPIDYTTANALINDNLESKISSGNYTNGYLINEILKRLFVNSQLDPKHSGLSVLCDRLVQWTKTNLANDINSIYSESPYNRMIIRVMVK